MIGLNPVRSLGQTVYDLVVGGLLLVAVGMFVWGQFQASRTGTWRERAEGASQAAAVAQRNADSANAGAENASATRSAMDAGTLTFRVETEQSAQRIETYANRPSADAGLEPVDPDVLRELAEAERQARAAADRLQRKGSR